MRYEMNVVSLVITVHHHDTVNYYESPCQYNISG